MNSPAKPHPVLAKKRFKEDYTELMESNSFDEYGWEFEPNFDELQMTVRMWSLDPNNQKEDEYCLFMDFSYYPEYPPMVKFVNPNTREFEIGKDNQWFPQKIKQKPPNVDLAFHLNYNYNGKGGRSRDQLICNSMVFEYYISNHNPKEFQQWTSKSTFYVTLYVIQKALTRPYYQGRAS